MMTREPSRLRPERKGDSTEKRLGKSGQLDLPFEEATRRRVVALYGWSHLEIAIDSIRKLEFEEENTE